MFKSAVHGRSFPSLAHVIDTGLVNQPNYDRRTQLLSTDIKMISEATYKQRRGRVGRTQPGTYHRLYSDEKMCTERAQFTCCPNFILCFLLWVSAHAGNCWGALRKAMAPHRPPQIEVLNMVRVRNRGALSSPLDAFPQNTVVTCRPICFSSCTSRAARRPWPVRCCCGSCG